MENRVYCLYRVSTDKQVDYNAKNEADIPMQRRECHKFAEQMGWTIIHEEQEEGVSGHKVRAERRDKVQILKEHAKLGKFDILLVFMFDRLGRIADETPFVLEWFVKNGIRVWSTQEGEQRFDSHTDKRTNYIRFWQADGESEKTSIRTKTALGQMVEDGHFKGDFAPYGYDLVKSGRINKRKHECYDLAINEAEAAIVRVMFDKCVHEGFGAWRIATYLNEKGIRNRSGKYWHPASVRGILGNLTYTGVLRSSESRSEALPHLRIIDRLVRGIFERMQSIPRSEVIGAGMHSKISEHAVLLRKAKADLAKAQGALDTLKAEVVKSLTGESAFSPTLLNGLIADAEANLCSSADVYAAAQAECDDEAATLAQIEREYSTLVGWAEMYDAASVEAKKMIVAYLVERVDVFRGYRIHVRFTIDLKQFGIEHEVETERTIQC